MNADFKALDLDASELPVSGSPELDGMDIGSKDADSSADEANLYALNGLYPLYADVLLRRLTHFLGNAAIVLSRAFTSALSRSESSPTLPRSCLMQHAPWRYVKSV